jgi:hypothetical protein
MLQERPRDCDPIPEYPVHTCEHWVEADRHSDQIRSEEALHLSTRNLQTISLIHSSALCDPASLHNTTLFRIRCCALILPQVSGGLFDEIAGLVEAYPVSFCVAHSLPDTEII